MTSLLKRIRNYMNIQRIIIDNDDWKYLIILDSCRYDYFKNYWKYGEIYKVNSPASSTLEWLKIVFPDYYDYLLFSCNPFIGDKKYPHWDYNAYEHFKKVFCLWRDNWSDKYSTVLPNSVYEYCIRKAIPKSIIWFLQPHAPYINLKIKKTPDDFRNWNTKYNYVDWSLITNKINKYSMTHIRYLYIYNLKCVIPYVLKLIEALEKPIIITSDHGELLGEYGLFGHPNIKAKELRSVPLVVIR